MGEVFVGDEAGPQTRLPRQILTGFEGRRFRAATQGLGRILL